MSSGGERTPVNGVKTTGWNVKNTPVPASSNVEGATLIGGSARQRKLPPQPVRPQLRVHPRLEQGPELGFDRGNPRVKISYPYPTLLKFQPLTKGRENP
jgi:hypothetical protein